MSPRDCPSPKSRSLGDGKRRCKSPRRRKILSCVTCRRKKLQCDRSLPACTRCSTSGQAKQCIYVEDIRDLPTDVPKNSNGIPKTPDSFCARDSRSRKTPPRGSFTSRPLVPHIKSRDAQPTDTSGLPIHNSGHSGHQKPTLRAEANSVPPPASDGTWIPPLRGKAFATRFNGGTHVSMILNQMPGLEQLTKEAFNKYPIMNRIRHDLHQSETCEVTKTLGSTTTLDNLLTLLPPKEEADGLIESYLNSFECVYHVLHLPTFEDAYKEFWTTKVPHQQNFLTSLLLMVAISLCTTPIELENPNSGQMCRRDRATLIIQTCEQWLQSKPIRYNRLVDFQAAFLLLLACQINGKRYKRTWPNSGKLLRLLMTAGFHRESDQLEEEPCLDREIRRRTWAAVAEFELQASFEQGMPPSPWVQQCNILCPANIPDSVLGDPRGTIDSDQGMNHSWYLSMSTNTLHLRHSLTNILNDTNTCITLAQVTHFTERIMSHLSAIYPHSSPPFRPIPSLLSLNLHQFQLALHMRQVIHATSTLEKEYSLMILWNTAKEVIHIHRQMLENGDRMLLVLCGDQFRAALTLCYVALTCKSSPNILALNITAQEFFHSIRHAIELMEHKFLHYGGDQRQLWITMACQTFISGIDEPHRKNHSLELTIGNFATLFHKRGHTCLLYTSPSPRD